MRRARDVIDSERLTRLLGHWLVGAGPLYRPPSLNAVTAAGRPIDRLSCKRRQRPWVDAYLEMFVRRRVVLIPPGVGVAPPRTRVGAYVMGGRCSYPVRTLEPTGLIEIASVAPVTLGDFFAVWGQRLGRHRLAGFSGVVVAFVNGVRSRGDPGSIRLRPHTVVVLEVDGYLRPHATYQFPPDR